MSTNDLLVKVATELQYDYDVPKDLIASSTGISSTLDENSLQNIYYINGAQVFVAYQSGKSTGVESPAWVVEDTLFPSNVTPVILRTTTQPDSRADTLLVASKSNDLWVLKTGVRFPKWVQYTNPTGFNIVEVKPAYDTAGNLQVSAVLYSTAGANHMMYTINLAAGNWIVDKGVQVVTLNVTDFELSSAFSSTDDSSTYGYLLASANGIAAITAAATKFRAQKPVASGNWTAVCDVELPYTSAMPLVFGIEAQTQLGAYFQAGSDGKLQRVALFGTTKLQSIKAVLRRAADPPSSMDSQGNVVPPPSVWIEVFALDINGNILHLESDMSQEPLLVANDSYASYYAITAWKDSSVLASQMNGMVVTSTPDGFALVVGVGQDNSLQQWAQDPTTTDWTSEKIAIPDPSGSTQAAQKTVYYVEVTAFDGNHAPCPGVTAVINAIEYTHININGKSATVDSNRSYTANTNALGKLCFTYDAPDSLAAPTINLWVQGMATDERMDVAPSGDIQKTFHTITSDQLKAATNQVTGQPVLNVDDQTRAALATALNQVMGVFDPSNPPAPSVDAASDPRKYVHPRTPGYLAATRKRHHRSLGHIRGNSRMGVHIEYLDEANGPLLRTQVMSDEEAGQKIAELRALGFSFLNISWGDLFRSIGQGIINVVTSTFKAIKDGVEAFFTLVKDGVTYAWNGVANFVRQAFDFVTSVFEKVKVFFKDLFEWLAYILNWDDMKHTAESFKQLVTGFQQDGTDWLTNTLPQATDSFFKQLKAGLSAKIDAAKITMDGVNIGSYDSTSPSADSMLSADGSGSKQGLLDDLPSTAMWLLNKILNAGGGDGGYAFVSSSLTTLQDAFSSFAEAANTAGLSNDLEAAVNDFTALFASFSDRNAADGTAFNHLLDLMKDAVNVVIDLIETLVLVFEKVAAEAFKFFLELLDAPVNLPIVSMIFKAVTGTELSVINSVCYALAVPFTIIYKIITGEKPFPNSDPLMHSAVDIRALNAVDARTVSRGVLALVNSPLDAFQDVLGVLFDAAKKFPGAEVTTTPFLNCAGVIVPVINATLSYDALSSGVPMKVATWSVGTAVPVMTIAWLAMNKLQRGPRGDIRGQILFGLLGLSQLGMAIWHAADPTKTAGGTVSDKEKAAITAQFFGFLSPTCKPLRAISQRSADTVTVLAVGVAMPVIDLISGIGNGSALIAAGTLTT